MAANGKFRAFLEGSTSKYFFIACIVCIGMLTAAAVSLAIFKDVSGENGSFVSAQEVSISGEWKLMHGDLKEYSQTEFDDSEWQLVNLPANTDDPNGESNAIQWLRKHVFIPFDESGSINAISLGSIHAADEVYFNGERIGSTGSMTDEWDINYDKVRIYLLPQGLLNRGGMNVVAVRVRSVFPDISGIYKGTLAIGNQSDFTARMMLHDVPLVVVILILLYSGVIFVFLSIVRSSGESEYVLLSTFIVLMAIFILLTTHLRFSINLDFILDKKIKFSILAMMLPVCMRFVYVILLSNEKHGLVGKISKVTDIFSRWIFIYPLVYIITNLIIGNIGIWSTLDVALNDNVILVFAAVTFVIILYMVIKGNREAMLLMGGLIVFAATVVYDIAVPEQSVSFTINYSAFGALALVMFMNLIVVYRFHKLTFSLGKANMKIEAHSRELELKVHEQTISLVEANSKLEVNNKNLSDLNVQLKSAQAKLERIARTDSLTGLYNRFELDKRLQYEVHSIKRYGKCAFEGFSILFIDIDNFKYFNDTFGHQAGDMILICFAKILKSSTRMVDIVARYGGDEFIVLMPNTNYEGAKKMAERIVEKLEEADSFKQNIEEFIGRPVSIDQEHRLSGSYGIAEYVMDETIDELIRRADKALYMMKGLKR